ncbi:protein O-linked-mannose beta-1,2-N-acetylglucosaminyltransferase 1-like isoform X2 [Panulirus ornatus]|uniref:protein O-linked-mannose beta-1,2-N-acetylglucosaminyltransferase 1-like isoform X2 n=1 Tax=Panulirus ornatus TaxID=150431 RepID=UPI003A8B2672
MWESVKILLVFISWSVPQVECLARDGDVEASQAGGPITSSVPQEALQPRGLLVSVRSSREAALLTTNFSSVVITDVYPEAPDASLTNHTNLGLYVVIIHQSMGRVMGRFQHFQPWSDLRRVQTFLNTIQPGRILVFMLRGDLSYGMPPEVRVFLQRQGSAGASSLVGRGALWAWAWVKGGRTLAETLTLPTREAMASGLLLQVYLNLAPPAEVCPEWPSGEHWELRRSFCDQHEQYGDLCSCPTPDLLTPTTAKIENNQIEKAAIILVAHRVPALYRSLRTVMSAQGFDRSRLEVFTPTPHQELAEFLRLMGLPLTVTHQESRYIATLISKQFVFAIRYVLDKYQDADFVIVLEEDISVSPDFFVSASLLQHDASLHCASAHNDLSYPHTSHDPRAVLRAESYTNYGWMVRREFARVMAWELARQEEEEYDWDVYTYHFLRDGRECVIPEVSRSHHFGDAGSHISQFTVRLYFSDKNFNQDPNATVEGIERLEQATYEAHITSLLQRARFINVSQTNPCEDDYFSYRFTVDEDDILVLFFHVEEDIRYFRFNNEWIALASCLGTFALESREGHHGLYRLRYGPAHLLLVAYPASPYSSIKPADVTVFRATTEILAAAFRKGGGQLRQEHYHLQPIQKRYTHLADAGPPPYHFQ